MCWQPKHTFPFTYRLTVAYNGLRYLGWQVQPQGTTIQSALTEALEKICQEPVSVIGSGRTDSGVHAKGQVAHFRSHKEFDPKKLLRALNGLLPHDIRILEAVSAPANFHALYTAKSKEYHYHLWTDPIADPFLYPFRWHVRRPLDLERLKEGAAKLVGTHDFSALANENDKGAAGRGAVRTLSMCQIVEQEGGLRIELASNGFLYKMVRNIVGTLVNGAYVNSNRPWYIDNLDTILASKDRRKAGRAAPPQGLFLVSVRY